MNRNKCVIVVPIYKTEFNYDEYQSVSQLFKVLGNYDIIAYCPESLNLTYYINTFNFTNYYVFWDEYFTEYPGGYNKLMLQTGFYEMFSNYEYMLVYQPDSWVFKDELEYWCNKGYDYIGAPFFFINENEWWLNICQIGNGGFSLRKISWWIYACDKYHEACEQIWHSGDTLYGEDHILTYLSLFGINDYNVPNIIEASAFSFDTDPQFAYLINQRKLPFGCHAYKKVIGHSFYDALNLYKDKKLFSVVTFLFGDYDILRDPNVVDDNAEYICITDRNDLTSNVWKFVKLEGYDLSKYNDWQKTLIARYSALKYIHTDICIKIDASVHIKKSLNDFIISRMFGTSIIDAYFLIHPWRDNYLKEYDEWINTRELDSLQKNNFIDYCTSMNFDYNRKGMIMTTIMIQKNNTVNNELDEYVLNTLMNINNFNVRVDQTYFSIIFANLFWPKMKMHFLSMQVLDSDYFEYFYHNQNYTHSGEYKYDDTNIEFKYINDFRVPCLYMK